MIQATKILNQFVGGPRRPARRAGLTLLILALAALLVFSSGTANAQVLANTGAVSITIVGPIKAITVDTPGDPFSSGTISVGTIPLLVAGDYVVIIPRNLLIDMPNGDVLTLQQFVAGAKVSGLPIEGNGIATIQANKVADGRVLAGTVNIAKGGDILMGQVTFINHTDGYLRINGTANADLGGSMLRINDPAGVHTVQQGLGCSALGGPNCSPDTRFGANIGEGYTVSFNTGMPACIPRSAADALCPASNRTANKVVADSTRFAPIQVGDNLFATGNYETVNLVTFMSAWSVQVFDKLTTQNTPTQPDYVHISTARWEVPGFPSNRIRVQFVTGSGTDPQPVGIVSPRFDIFSMHRGQDNVPHELPFATTVNNPATAIDFPPGSQLFQIHYDIDFNLLLAGLNRAELSACGPLINAGFPTVCPLGGTLEEEARIVSPVAREIIARTRHQKELNPGVVALNMKGAVTPTGQFLAPVDAHFPGFAEPELGTDKFTVSTPYIFEGVPWLLDRRVGVGGCVGACVNTPIPLSPFSISGLDPRTQVSPFSGTIPLPAAVRNQPVAFFPFGGVSGNAAVGLLTIPLVP